MKRRAFTLVEILVVVIILGILGVITIPQFNNASNDARASSTMTTLQTIRQQMELFKIQHGDVPATVTALTNWQVMLTTSTTTETSLINPVGTVFGPYLQTAPRNPLNGYSTVSSTIATNVGWYYTVSTTGTRYTFQAVDTAGTTVLTNY